MLGQSAVLESGRNIETILLGYKIDNQFDTHLSIG